MSGAFLFASLLTVVSAAAAMAMRNLIHCVLSLAVSLLGLAAIYLQLNAQFVGFAQILVYVGAVGILILFAILLTGGSEPGPQSPFSSSWWIGLGVALGVFGLISSVVLGSRVVGRTASVAAESTVKQIGDQLMTTYVLPLEVVGLLLTIALLGAVVIALRDDGGERRTGDWGLGTGDDSERGRP